MSSGALKNWRSSEKPLDESGALRVMRTYLAYPGISQVYFSTCQDGTNLIKKPHFVWHTLSKVVFGSSLQAPTDNRPGKEAESFLLVAARPALGDGRSELS